MLALEIVEHVADRDRFLAALARLVKPGGIFIGATLNRTARAFAMAIIGAEYVLRWLPPGTHDWSRFVRPSEFSLPLRRAGLATTRLAGMSYDSARRRMANLRRPLGQLHAGRGAALIIPRPSRRGSC